MDGKDYNAFLRLKKKTKRLDTIASLAGQTASFGNNRKGKIVFANDGDVHVDTGKGAPTRIRISDINNLG